MKFNDMTYVISIVILCITIVYTLLYSGVTGLLMSSAVALFAAAFVEQFELIVAITVIFALFYTLFLKKFIKRFEPFQNQEIVNRIAEMQHNKGNNSSRASHAPRQPVGVYNPKVEGFQDVSPTVEKEGESQESSAAAASKTGQHQVDTEHANKVTAAINSDKEKENEEFQSATNGLFKLGKMPSEHEDGPKLDAGKTIMKAVGSFDPKTISAMTTDTKKLLDTQKGLMEMLTQMRPVLADGKELLQTFSGMFSGGKGGGGGMPFSL